MYKRSILASVILAPVFAMASEPQEVVLKETTISATRIEQNLEDVVQTVKVINQSDIEKMGAQNIKDVMQYEPDISVRFTPNRGNTALSNSGRGGNEGINIRGLEGNQVLMQTDGVRLPLGYGSGAFYSGRGDYIDVDAFKSIEVVKGSASSMYGSDGLAGSVSFSTKDPSDLLTLGNSHQSSLKFGYSSADKTYSLVPTFAASGELFEGMILGSFKRGHEVDTKGTNKSANYDRTKNNPSDVDSDYILGKLIYKIDSNNRLKATVEHMDRNYDTDLLSIINDPSYMTTIGSTTKGDITRTLAKLDYEYASNRNPIIQNAKASIYYQDSENSQYGGEVKSAVSSGWLTRWRENSYMEETLGASVLFESNIVSSIEHRLIYGADVALTKAKVMNDGANLTEAGVPHSSFAPKRNFPESDYDTYGIYIHDEITIGDLSLIPGLRYDKFKITPHADDLYRINNIEVPTAHSDDEFSPKFGLIYKLDPLLHLHASYAHGFRSPTPWNVNGGTSNLNSNYKSIGNPNLKPETSDSYEIGFRGSDDKFKYHVAGFYSKYKDFIASGQKVGGSSTPADPTIYQSINLNDVKIHGYEIGGEYNIDSNWRVSTAFAKTWGNSSIDGVKEKLYTIEPAKWINTLQYNSDTLSAQMVYSHVQKRENTDSDYVTASSYDILDVMANYAWSKNLSFNAAIYNLFDSKYFHWSDVRDVKKTFKQIDAFSQPGRNFMLSMKVTF